MIIGSLAGVVAAVFFLELLKRHWIADHLQSPFALMLVVTSFTISNLYAHESGLVAVTLMGVILANQHRVTIHHIVEFKENLTVLLISGLFILLAARLNVQNFQDLGWRGAAFVLFVITVARPISVGVSTIGSDLNTAERVFLAWLAPRGIVAAAVASVFALELGRGDDFVAATFMVIIGTVGVYGLTTGWVARRLGLSIPDPQGILFASAHPGARAIAKALQDAGVAVRLIDRNPENLRVARMEGLPTFYADILSDAVQEELDLGGMGRFLALTSNDEVNSLAASHFAEIFGRSEVYRLSAPPERSRRREKSAEVLHGRVLFDNTATYDFLDKRFESGAVIRRTRLTDEFTFDDFRNEFRDSALLLFAIDEHGHVHVCTPDHPPNLRAGLTLLSLVNAEPSAAA
ncbi:MAG: cation:proton antiporter [Planctomycetaceae bacterium]